MEVIQQGEIYC